MPLATDQYHGPALAIYAKAIRTEEKWVGGKTVEFAVSLVHSRAISVSLAPRALLSVNDEFSGHHLSQ